MSSTQDIFAALDQEASTAMDANGFRPKNDVLELAHANFIFLLHNDSLAFSERMRLLKEIFRYKKETGSTLNLTEYHSLHHVIIHSGSRLATRHGGHKKTLTEDQFKELIAYFMTEGLNINNKSGTSMGESVLFRAVEYGNSEALKALLYHGANIEATNKHQSTPFLSAAKYGGVNEARILIEHGANTDKTSFDGATSGLYGALHLAAEQGHFKMVQFLVEHYAIRGAGVALEKIEQKNEHGLTPAMCAEKISASEVTSYLEEVSLALKERAAFEEIQQHAASLNGTTESVTVPEAALKKSGNSKIKSL